LSNSHGVVECDSLEVGQTSKDETANHEFRRMKLAEPALELGFGQLHVASYCVQRLSAAAAGAGILVVIDIVRVP
jgi:hypothetical protein